MNDANLAFILGGAIVALIILLPQFLWDRLVTHKTHTWKCKNAGCTAYFASEVEEQVDVAVDAHRVFHFQERRI